MAIHVVEHNGFEVISRDDECVYYEHRIYETRLDDGYNPGYGKKVIYLAGGCFWGMERAFQELNGVTETVVGYANGHVSNPTYEEVCRHETGFRECIRVTYDPDVTDTDTVLKAYFICVDPTRNDGQGGDIGEQYLLGIYYKDESMQKAVTEYLEEEKKKYPAFYVENKMLDCFYEAEEYHQDYLLKNPSGYCHITRVEMDEIKALN
ncbi:MAG: peptide-methionine (S)-S-oxide reductase MsrA [Lachnospiraceae bacterium]|nr:peptide-methionine (S)-S-oxide reductase MsrA [Lachnospiraceae bacterium]